MLRSFVTGGTLFNELGFYYIGPIDGHDINNLVTILENIKNSKLKSAIDILHESKIWPENLGVGKPYNPDERIEHYLIYYCLEKMTI